MHTEYEVRILEIDVPKMRNKLEELGAKKRGTYFQKRYVYEFNPHIEGKFIRLRTNGEKTTLTIKHHYDRQKIGGTSELETEVEDFDTMHKILQELGYKPQCYQENKRETYDLNGVEIDLDTWPRIPTFMEIEAQDKETVLAYADKLEVTSYPMTTEDAKHVYLKYGIDLDAIDNLTFEEEKHETI